MNSFTSLFTKVLFCGALVLSAASLHAEAAYDERPMPLKTPPPSYPDQLRRDGVEGMVAVKVLIDESGNVAECAISKSSHEGFERAALDAIRAWKFRPASKAGSPVRASIIVPIKFSAEA